MAYHTTVVAAIAYNHAVFQGYVVLFAGIYQCIGLAIGMSANAVGRTKKVGGKAYFTGHFSLEELQLVGIREFGPDTLPHKIGNQCITVADDTNYISSLFQGCHHIFYI